jgi:transglutaminase-like putative cysteine protease
MRLRLTITAAVATVLSSIGLYPLYSMDGPGAWFTPGAAAVIIVAGTGVLTRLYRVPAVVALLTSVVVMLFYLTGLYAATEAYAGLIPTPESMLRLGQIFEQGWLIANRYAAPVPVHPGIALMTVAGIGGVAICVDFLAVRLRRAAPAGLPLLALYSVPAAVREESISWLAFVLGAAGYLALLLADAREQVSGWGRPVFTRRRSPREVLETPDSSALAITGRRIGATALVFAIAVPLAIPGLRTQGLFGVGGIGKRTQTARITMPDPLVSLRRQLTLPENAPVLTYRVVGGQPGAAQTAGPPDYLRLNSMDRFDGESWRMTPVRGTRNDRIGNRQLPAAPGLIHPARRPVTGEITIDRRVERVPFLPMPYPPSRVEIEGDWRVDAESLMVYTLQDVPGGLRYRVTSLKVEPTAAQLSASGRPGLGFADRYLVVPRSVPPDIIRLAREVTEDAATPYNKAVRLQSWFTKPGRFHYNTQVPSPRNVSALRDFLLRSRTGYCEQFAASMALMARVIGIPARVATGYTQGTPGRAPGEWIVSSHDAHAWPELYFEGIGWLRFEPTPTGGDGQGTATIPSYSVPAPVGGPGTPGEEGGEEENTVQPTPSASPGLAAGQRPRELPDRAPGAGAANAGADENRLPVGWLLAATGVILALAVPAVVRRLTRRRRWRTAKDAYGAATAAWLELRDDVLDHGLAWTASESPRAVVRRLGERFDGDGPAAKALAGIARAEERARYAPAPDPGARLRADGRLVRQALARSVGRGARLRARLVPSSTVLALRGLAWRVLEAFDWLDLLGSRRRGRRAAHLGRSGLSRLDGIRLGSTSRP